MTTSRWATGPTLRTPSELVQLTSRVAEEVRAGLHPIDFDPSCRWYQLLNTDGYVDVWLIGWTTDQSTELHDHAGSLGALTVVHGVLTEQRWTPTRGEIRRRCLRAGRSVGFGLGHVHDVANTASEPAVSVHAYAPPLTAMSYYRVEAGARLRRTRSVLVAGDPGLGWEVPA